MTLNKEQYCSLCQCLLRLLFEDQEKGIYHCTQCQLVLTMSWNPRDYLSCYNSSYFQNNYLPYNVLYQAFFERCLIHLEHFQKPASLLDVGCGVGNFLSVAKKRGWRVTGVEPSSTACALSQKNIPDAPIFPGTLLELSSPRGAFEMITFWDSLAHIPEISKTLSRAWELLTPGGLLVIKSPYRPVSYLRLVGFFSPLFGRQITSGLIHFPMQIYHFTPFVLTQFFNKLGGDVLQVQFLMELRKPSSNWRKFIHPYSLTVRLFKTAAYLVTQKESFLIVIRKKSESQIS